MSTTEIVQLFRTIASEHGIIQHGVDGRNSFSRALLTIDRAMGIVRDLREFMANIRGRFEYPILLLALPDINYLIKNKAQYKKQFMVSYYIIDGYQGDSGPDNIEAIHSRLEKIGEDVLSYLLWYFGKGENAVAGQVSPLAPQGTHLDKIGENNLLAYRIDLLIDVPINSILCAAPTAAFPDKDFTP